MRVDQVPPAAAGGGVQSNQTLGLYATSNTTGASSSSTFDARSITFQGAGIASVGYSNGSVVFSVPAGGGGGDGVNILAAGTQTAATTGTVLFSNSNGITFGMSGSSRITASHDGLTSQSNQAVTAGNGSFAFQTLSFSNANGVSFSTSAGSAIVASHNGLTSQSNQAFSASGGSSAFQTLNFANSNGITFSNSNGSVIASHNGLTTARASNDAIGLNTAQSNVTWTVNSNGLSLDARGYAGTGTSATNASITLNSNGLAISVAAPGGGGAVNFSAGTTSNNLQSVVFSNSNGVSFGLNGSTITGSHNGLTTARASNDGIGLATAQSNVTWTANSAGLSLDARGYAGTGTTFAGANISGSATLNSVGLNLSLSAAAPGGGAAGTIQGIRIPCEWGQSTSLMTAHQSLLVQPMAVPGHFEFSAAIIPLSISVSSSSNSSHAGVISLSAAIYSRNNSSMSLMASGATHYQWTNTSNNSNSSISGLRRLTVPLQSTLEAGEYWFAVISKTSTTNANWFTGSYVAAGVANSNFGNGIGALTSASIMAYPGLGAYSVTTSQFPSSIAFSEMRTQARVAYAQIVNWTA